MNRQDRDRYDYGRYEGYRNDEHYHSARNLTDEFENEYRRERGLSGDDDRYRPEHSYHEGSEIEDTLRNRRMPQDSFRARNEYMRSDRDTDRNYYGNYSNNPDNYRESSGSNLIDQDMYQNRDYKNPRSGYRGDINSYNRSHYSGSRSQQDYNTGDYRNSRYSGRDYSDGSNYSGPYGYDEDSNYNYNRNRSQSGFNRWEDSDERTRYY